MKFASGTQTARYMDLDVLLAVLLFAAAAGYMVLAARLVFGQEGASGVSVGVTFAVIGIWVAGGFLELATGNFVVFSIGRTAHFVGAGLVPVALFVCFREYIGVRTSPKIIAALLLVPTLSIVLAATNYWHQLMWGGPATNPLGEFLTRPEYWGPWFQFVFAPYGYVLVTASVLTLVLHSTAVAPAHRRGLLMLAGSAIAPVMAAVAYDSGFGPNTISPVPLTFAVMLPIYAWLIIGERIIDFSPVAYETVFQHMQDPVVVLDDQQRIIGLNKGAEMLLQMKEKDAMRESLESVFGGDVPEVYEALDTGTPQKMLTTTGRFLHLRVTPISTNKAMAKSGRVLTFRDVSDVEQAQKEVRTSERLLRTLIDHSLNGIIRFRWVGILDQRSLRCTFANSAAGRYLNIEVDAMIDRTAEDLVRRAMTGMEPAEIRRILRDFDIAVENRNVVDLEVMAESDGVERWLRVMGEPVGDDVAITFVDITDRKAKEQHMESIAQTDPLTGVLNRRGFEREASDRLLNSDDNATGALLFIDLNAFKQVNDQFGHEVGDRVLMIAAERLQANLRSKDIIGRPGGDEFVALVPDVDGAIAETLATRLATALEEPYKVANRSHHCAASIGLALYPEHANTLTGLLRAADQAMYRAKARCRGVTNVRNADLLEKAS